MACTAYDKHGNTASAGFTVTVKGADARLADLLVGVTGLGPGTSLADKATRAQTYLAANDTADACSTLTAFVSEVEAQTGKTVAAGEAASLIAAAQQIETVLGC